MSAVLVVCPHCGKELKLRDQSKLNHKGKCPACARPFILREAVQEEVSLELAEESIPVGTAAQWVPNEPAVAPLRTRPEIAPRSPEAARMPPPSGVPTVSTAPLAPLAGLDAGDGGIQRLKELRRRNAQRRNLAILFGGLTALAVAGAVWGLSTYWKPAETVDPHAVAIAPTPAPTTTVTPTPATVPGAAAPPGAGALPSVIPGSNEGTVIIPYQDVATLTQRRQNAELVETLWPRRGDPVQLQMIPSGMNFVIHLRPALLWSDEPQWQEFRYSLTEDVTNWIAARLKEVCRREPKQIEECVIALRLGAIGTEPQVAAAVSFVREEKLSDLIEEFRGLRLSEEGPRILISSPYAYLIRDTRSVAIAPEQDAAELAEVVNTANTNSSEGVYQLLNLTDRQRVLTVVFEVDDVKRHEGWLFSDRTRATFQRVLNWFGDDVETVAWSVDLHGDSFASELMLRPRSVSNSSRVAAEFLQKLEFLPRELQSMCVRMRPATQGYRALIGRFPAMLEAYRQATIPTLETRHVRLTTVLPRKAAPNLALGTLLTWDQAMQTDFTTAAPPTVVAAANPQAGNLPEKIEDRLKRTLEGEFNQPFQDAVAYIASETQVQIDIDGNALKDAGFTKNMPIKLSLGRVSGLEAFKQIILSERCRPPTPDKRICIVIDEANRRVLVSTEAFAKANGQQVYPLITE
jgi:hypothetical protein